MIRTESDSSCGVATGSTLLRFVVECRWLQLRRVQVSALRSSQRLLRGGH